MKWDPFLKASFLKDWDQVAHRKFFYSSPEIEVRKNSYYKHCSCEICVPF